MYGFAYCDDYYIIHPDDIACQYGPIATELRKMAVDDCYYSPRPFGQMALLFMLDQNEEALFEEDDVFSCLCLFAAELAADEGM